MTTTTTTHLSVVVTMTLNGVDYTALTANATLLASVETSLQESFAREAGQGFGPEWVSITFQSARRLTESDEADSGDTSDAEVPPAPLRRLSGAVVVQASIFLPQASMMTNVTALVTASSSVTERIAAGVASVPGISSVTTGAISVSGLTARANEAAAFDCDGSTLSASLGANYDEDSLTACLNLTHQATCQPSCVAGYTVVCNGDLQPNCPPISCFDGKFLTENQRCAADCASPPVVDNLLGSLSHCVGTIHGQQCNFTCQDGYHPFEPLTCTDGVFANAATARCVEDSCTDGVLGLPFLGAKHNFTEMSAACGDLQHGAQCRAACKANHTLVCADANQSECELMTCDKGQIIVPGHQCVPDCTTAPRVQHSNGTLTHCEPTRHGSACSFQCAEGYHASGPLHCANGTFDNAVCLPNPCAGPPQWLSSRAGLDERAMGAECTDLRHNASCRAACQAGYTLNCSGVERCGIISCSLGHFQGVDAVRCDPSSCTGTPQVRQHYDLASMRACADLDHGSRCSAACESGYSLVCLDSNGTETGRQDCGAISCGFGEFNVGYHRCARSCAMPSIAHVAPAGRCNLTRHGEKCDFTCAPGYHPTGPLTCTDGVFDSQQCEPDPCLGMPPLMDPEGYDLNGSMAECVDLLHGENCSAACQPKYELVCEDPDDASCGQITCNLGRFELRPQRCAPWCLSAPIVEHAVSSSLDCAPAPPGASCALHCEAGFLSTGSLRCVDGAFQGAACRPANCTEPPTLPRHAEGACGAASLPHGAECELRCQIGYAATDTFVCSYGEYVAANGSGIECQPLPSCGPLPSFPGYALSLLLAKTGDPEVEQRHYASGARWLLQCAAPRRQSLGQERHVVCADGRWQLEDSGGALQPVPSDTASLLVCEDPSCPALSPPAGGVFSCNASQGSDGTLPHWTACTLQCPTKGVNATQGDLVQQCRYTRVDNSSSLEAFSPFDAPDDAQAAFAPFRQVVTAGTLQHVLEEGQVQLCEQVTCPPPVIAGVPVIVGQQDVTVTATSGTIQRVECTGSSYGDVCTPVCSYGFRVAAGAEKMTCAVNGRFVGSVACVEKVCEAEPLWEFGQTGAVEQACGGKTHGSNCSVTCAAGYVANGVPAFDCDNAQWRLRATSTPPCLEMNCSATPNIQGWGNSSNCSLLAGAVCQGVCESGYTMNGYLQCERGEWHTYGLGCTRSGTGGTVEATVLPFAMTFALPGTNESIASVEWAEQNRGPITNAVARSLGVSAQQVFIRSVRQLSEGVRRLSALQGDKALVHAGRRTQASQGFVVDFIVVVAPTDSVSSLQQSVSSFTTTGGSEQAAFVANLEDALVEAGVEAPASLSTISIGGYVGTVVASFQMPVSEWIVVGDWGDCPTTCGEAQRTRLVECTTGNVAACNNRSSMPAAEKRCSDYSECSFAFECPLGRGHSMSCLHQSLLVWGVPGSVFLCVMVCCLVFCYRNMRAPSSGEELIDNTKVSWRMENDREDKKMHIIWDLNAEKVEAFESRRLNNRTTLQSACGSSEGNSSEDDDISPDDVDLSGTGGDFVLEARVSTKSANGFIAGKVLEAHGSPTDFMAQLRQLGLSSLTSSTPLSSADPSPSINQEDGSVKALMLLNGHVCWQVGNDRLEGTKEVNDGKMHQIGVRYDSVADSFTILVDHYPDVKGLKAHPDHARAQWKAHGAGTGAAALEGDVLHITWNKRIVKDDMRDGVAVNAPPSLPTAPSGKLKYSSAGIYRKGDRVEYYSSTHKTWVSAMIELGDKAHANSRPTVDVRVNGQVRKQVPVTALRRPLEDGEDCRFYSVKDNRWLKAVISGRQPRNAAGQGYNIRLVQEQMDLHGVPPMRLQRNFEEGAPVNVYLGWDRGWAPATVVLSKQADSNSPSPRKSPPSPFSWKKDSGDSTPRCLSQGHGSKLDHKDNGSGPPEQFEKVFVRLDSANGPPRGFPGKDLRGSSSPRQTSFVPAYLVAFREADVTSPGNTSNYSNNDRDLEGNSPSGNLDIPPPVNLERKSSWGDNCVGDLTLPSSVTQKRRSSWGSAMAVSPGPTLTASGSGPTMRKMVAPLPQPRHSAPQAEEDVDADEAEIPI